MPPPRPASGDTIYVMYAYGKVTITVYMSMLACQYNQPKRPGDLYLDLESGVRVTCDVGYLCANFNLPRPLCLRLRPDVHDRHRTKASLNAPTY